MSILFVKLKSFPHPYSVLFVVTKTMKVQFYTCFMSDSTQLQITITQNWAITSTILSQTLTRSRVLRPSLNRSSRGTTFSRMRSRISRTECRRTASPAIVSCLWAARVKRRPHAATLPPASWRRSETKRARNWTLSSECSSPRRSGNLADVSNRTRAHVQMSATWLSFPLPMLFPGWCPIGKGGVTSHKCFVLGLEK